MNTIKKLTLMQRIASLSMGLWIVFDLLIVRMPNAIFIPVVIAFVVAVIMLCLKIEAEKKWDF